MLCIWLRAGHGGSGLILQKLPGLFCAKGHVGGFMCSQTHSPSCSTLFWAPGICPLWTVSLGSLASGRLLDLANGRY